MAWHTRRAQPGGAADLARCCATSTSCASTGRTRTTDRSSSWLPARCCGASGQASVACPRSSERVSRPDDGHAKHHLYLPWHSLISCSLGAACCRPRRPSPQDPAAAGRAVARRPHLPQPRAVPRGVVDFRHRGARRARRERTSTPSTSRSATAASGRRPTTAPPSSWSSTSRTSPASAAWRSRRRTPNVIYVGTGDAASVRVAYPGDGVYKSTDAGKTWQQRGARRHAATSAASSSTRRTPTSSTSRRWGTCGRTNEERGVFKSADGGKTWKKVLYVDDKTGAIDLVINRREPGHALRRDVRGAAAALAPATRARAPAAASTRRPTAAGPGRSWRAACRRARRGGSASTSTRRTRTSSTP